MCPKFTHQFWKKNTSYCATEIPESDAFFLSKLIKLVNMNIEEQLLPKGSNDALSFTLNLRHRKPRLRNCVALCSVRE